MNDLPVATRPDGTLIYDNTASVCIGVIYNSQGVFTIQRATNPGKELWALPGGFQMHGETWKECLSREIKEEINITIRTSEIRCFGNVITDKYNHNLIFGAINFHPLYYLKLNKDEVLDWKYSTLDNLDMREWAFQEHFLRTYDALKELN